MYVIVSTLARHSNSKTLLLSRIGTKPKRTGFLTRIVVDRIYNLNVLKYSEPKTELL